jgi:hypothetical protein
MIMEVYVPPQYQFTFAGLYGITHNLEESSFFNNMFYICLISSLAARGSVVVKVLCYKPEGHGFETR